MKTLAARVRRALAGLVAGKPEVQRIAHEKRLLERELRARGHSRTHARAIVAERFRDG